MSKIPPGPDLVAGTALVHGVDVWAEPTRSKALLGVLPDGLSTSDRLSGLDLVAHSGRLRGLDRETVAPRATELLHVLGLWDAGTTLVADYSAGMRKKVHLACALVHSPSVLVLDEPFEAVDPVSAQTIQGILRDFAGAGGTVIISSHVMATVQRFCGHVAIINRGIVVAAGTTAQVADGAATSRTASPSSWAPRRRGRACRGCDPRPTEAAPHPQRRHPQPVDDRHRRHRGPLRPRGAGVPVSGAAALGSRASTEAIATVLAAVGALAVLAWTLLPLLLTGLDSALDPHAMAARTVPSRGLARALAVGAGAGLPGILTGLGTLLPALTWALAGQSGPALLAVLMAPAALATCVLLSRVVVIGAGLTGSRRGRDGVAVIGVVLMLAMSMAPSLVSTAAASGYFDGARLATAGRVAGLTPFGWALAAPGYLALGEPVLAVLLALGAIALPAALLPLWERVVARVMTGPARTAGGARAYAETVVAGPGPASMVGLDTLPPSQRAVSRTGCCPGTGA